MTPDARCAFGPSLQRFQDHALRPQPLKRRPTPQFIEHSFGRDRRFLFFVTSVTSCSKSMNSPRTSVPTPRRSATHRTSPTCQLRRLAPDSRLASSPLSWLPAFLLIIRDCSRSLIGGHHTQRRSAIGPGTSYSTFLRDRTGHTIFVHHAKLLKFSGCNSHPAAWVALAGGHRREEGTKRNRRSVGDKRVTWRFGNLSGRNASARPASKSPMRTATLQ